MISRKVPVCAIGAAIASISLGSATAEATFHFMQIEQVIGAVNGDTAAQAIQLRMRSGGQHLMSQSRLRAWDAAGANPVLLVNITTDLAGPSFTGDRILIATAAFAATTTPAASSDYIMAPIPASYLAAGSLTFEDDFGTIYWRLSWGGTDYTGSNTGSITNDANGNFGPPFAGPLPSLNCHALRFPGAATALSVSNNTDYAVTSAASVWQKYHGPSYTITECVPAVSEWGAIALSLLFLTAATIVIRNRRFASVD